MILALSGPSGIGKGFVAEHLLKAYPFVKELRWFTTRPPRQGENGKNRICISETEFSNLSKAGKLVLIQKLYGYQYALNREDLLSRDVFLTEIHPGNIEKALEINPEIVAIGLVTFDLSLLHKRLSVVRKTESPLEIEKRIAVAQSEVETILRHRSLFASIIEVTRDSESSVAEQVLTVIASHLKEKGV